MREETVAKNYANQASSKLADMPRTGIAAGSLLAGCANRQNTKAMLLEGVERLRREANQLEALAYQVELIHGDADDMLYRLLSAHVHR